MYIKYVFSKDLNILLFCEPLIHSNPEIPQLKLHIKRKYGGGLKKDQKKIIKTEE